MSIETTEGETVNTCLVISCHNPKAEGWNFCEFHHADPEEVGRLRLRLEAAEQQHARLLSEIRDGRWVRR
jgi:hypothetical protein